MPTVMVEQVDHDKVLKKLVREGVVVYECTHAQMKSINTWIRQQTTKSVSCRAHTFDLQGNPLSYRFTLTEPRSRPGRPRKEGT